MGNKLNKRVLAGIGIVSAFILLMAALLASYYLGPGQGPAWLQILVVHHVEFMVGIALAGILVGIAIMMLAFERVEEKAVESKINAKMMLGFLGPDERNTIQHLVDSGGRAYQSEVGRMPGMSRLKAHRAVQKLGEKGILSTERNGKANKLVLAPAIFEALKQG